MAYIIAGIFFAVVIFFVFDAIRRGSARDTLIYQDEYRKASRANQRIMENEILSSYGQSTYINGVLVGTGEEIEALGNFLLYFEMADSDDSYLTAVGQLEDFVGPAEDQLEQLRDEDSSSQMVKDGEDYIATARKILVDPQAALAEWRAEKID